MKITRENAKNDLINLKNLLQLLQVRFCQPLCGCPVGCPIPASPSRGWRARCSPRRWADGRNSQTVGIPLSPLPPTHFPIGSSSSDSSCSVGLGSSRLLPLAVAFPPPPPLRASALKLVEAPSSSAGSAPAAIVSSQSSTSALTSWASMSRVVSSPLPTEEDYERPPPNCQEPSLFFSVPVLVSPPLHLSAARTQNLVDLVACSCLNSVKARSCVALNENYSLTKVSGKPSNWSTTAGTLSAA